MARTKAAKPAADEARPAAVGKLLRETILRGSDESLGSDESASSTSRRRVRSSARQACVRAPEISWSEPLRVSESLEYWLLHEAVVWVRRSSCESVTDRELLVGRLSLASRLPQYLCYSLASLFVLSWLLSQAYLITAMLTGAKVLARYTLLSAIVCVDVEKTFALESKSRRSTEGFNWLRLLVRLGRLYHASIISPFCRSCTLAPSLFGPGR